MMHTNTVTRRSNRNATMRTHSEQLKVVRKQNNDALVNHSYSNRFADADRAITARPASVSRLDACTQTSDSEEVDPGVQADDERDHVIPTCSQDGRRKRQRNYKLSLGHRCRTCGHVYTQPEWKKYHIIPRNESYNQQFPLMMYLPNQVGSKVYEHCTILCTCTHAEGGLYCSTWQKNATTKKEEE